MPVGRESDKVRRIKEESYLTRDLGRGVEVKPREPGARS